MDHTMAGVEDISGMMVGNYKMRDKYETDFAYLWIQI